MSELQGKLINIQKELKAPKTQTNTFGKYRYRSCEDILEAVKPLCAEQGVLLYITDRVKEIGSRVYVEAVASLFYKEEHFSVSAYAREAEVKKGMDEAQITGACSSYARKYALNGLFLIDDTKDPDTQDNTDEGYIDEKQLNTIRDYVDNKNVDKEKFLEYMGIDSIEKMPKSKYQKAVAALEAKK
ncbi:MAG: ERF family protein [Candidatus Hydrothermarchaeales archaeon]